MNKNGVPVTLVISQLLITTVAIIVLTNTGGGGNMSFLIALALTVVIYLCSYFMLFLGYMHLVCKQTDQQRSFNIPGGKGVKLVVATVGLIVSILAFFVSFFPPSSLPGGADATTYVTLLGVSFVIIFLLPFIIYAFHNKAGKSTNVSMVHIKAHNAPVNHFFIHPRARSAYELVHKDQKKSKTK